MRIAFIGVNHWHFRTFLACFQSIPGVEIVGVTDPDASIAKRVGDELGCRWSADFRGMTSELKPEFVMALGRHCDMAAVADFLMDEGIPFAMDKPSGMNHAEVAATAAKASRTGAFAAVALSERQGQMLHFLREHARDEALDYVTFRFVTQPTIWYEQAGSAWALDPKLAGGGVLVGLGVHYLDLFTLLTAPHPVRVVSAMVSNRAERRGVEDFAQVVLEAGGTLGLVQVGYLRPGKNDRDYSVRTAGHYFSVGAEESIDITDLTDGTTSSHPFEGNRSAARRLFAVDVLERVRNGSPPVADMTHMAAAMEIAQEAYRVASPGLIATSGLDPLLSGR